jgi:hypothetical protein
VFKLTVVAANPVQLQINDASQLSSCKAGTSKQIDFKAVDKYGNFVEDVRQNMIAL